MNYAEPIRKMIEQRIEKVNTLSVGVLKKIDLARWRADVQLKYTVQGVPLNLTDVPIALPAWKTGALHIAPTAGDVVLVGFSKYEIQKQLRNRDIVPVNELVLHNLQHAVVLGGIHTESDTVPAVQAGEILISHRSGSYIRFTEEGDIQIGAKGEIQMDKVIS